MYNKALQEVLGMVLVHYDTDRNTYLYSDQQTNNTVELRLKTVTINHKKIINGWEIYKRNGKRVKE